MNPLESVHARDVSRMVLMPSSGSSVLEQIVLSSFFRGGESIIDAPYSVRHLEQPLVKLLGNQLAIYNLAEQGFSSWMNIAGIFASEHIMVVPPIAEVYLARSVVEKCELGFDMLENANSENERIAAVQFIKTYFSLGSTLRVPEAVTFFRRFLSEFSKPEDPYLSAEFDFLRRVAEKSLQDTLGTSRDTLTELIKQYDRKPTLRNARLVDVFARYNAYLSLPQSSPCFVTGYPGYMPDSLYRDMPHITDTEAVGFLDAARRIYEDIISRRKWFEDWKIMDSAYASLISFDMLLGDREAAWRHIRMARFFNRYRKAEYAAHLAENSLLRDGIALAPQSAQALSLSELDVEYRPDLFIPFIGKLLEFYSDKDTLPSSLILSAENFMDYCRKTALTEIRYFEEEGVLKRSFVFNQKPYLTFEEETRQEAAPGSFIVTQVADTDYTGNLKRMMWPLIIRLESLLLRTEQRAYSKYLAPGISRALTNIPELRIDLAESSADYSCGPCQKLEVKLSRMRSMQDTQLHTYHIS